MGGSDPYLAFVLDHLRYERKRFAEVLAAAIDYFVDDGVTKERVVDKVRKAFKHLADTGQIRPFVADAGSPGTVVPGVLFDFSGRFEDVPEYVWSEELIALFRRHSSWPLEPFELEVDRDGVRRNVIVTDRWTVAMPEEPSQNGAVDPDAAARRNEEARADDEARVSGDRGTAEEETETTEEQGFPALFIRMGRLWQVRFGGGNSVPMPDGNGMKVLHFLLGRPHKPIGIRDLVTEVALMPDEKRDHSGADIVADSRAAREIDDRIQRLKAKMGSRDAAEAEAAEAELKSLYRHAKGIKSRLDPELKNLVDKTKKSVDRSRTAIGEVPGMDALAAHLLGFVEIKRFCSYTPDRRIDWQL